jgi:hypothetical protein
MYKNNMKAVPMQVESQAKASVLMTEITSYTPRMKTSNELL